MKVFEIERFVNAKNPKVHGKMYHQIVYGEEIGGMYTGDVKFVGQVYLPLTSWASGKMTLRDVKIPHNINIISLSIHSEHKRIDKVGDFVLVKDFRIRRGVYVSGLILPEEHHYLNARIIIGYDLHIYGREHLSLKNYKKTQKKSNYE